MRAPKHAAPTSVGAPMRLTSCAVIRTDSHVEEKALRVYPFFERLARPRNFTRSLGSIPATSLFPDCLRIRTMPMANEPKLDCYAILEVSSDAEDAVIRTAFAAQVQKFGSEQFPGTPAAGRQKLSDLNSAYQVLIDPVRRRRYDLHRRISAISAACAQTNSTEAHDSPRKAKPAPGEDRVSSARTGRYRVPLIVLIAAVVALTAFSTFHYSNRPPERPVASPSAPPVAVADQPADLLLLSPFHRPSLAAIPRSG